MLFLLHQLSNIIMNLSIYSKIIFLSFVYFGFAQNSQDPILFSVNETPISKSEFKRVYSKNLDLVKDESQKDIDNYLELYINYQLKLAEAKALGYDKDPKYLREFKSYKNQLLKSYINDNEVTDKLVLEAYNRMQYEVNASHVLIRIDENSLDTLDVYNKLMTIKSRIINEGFQKVKNELHDGKTVFAEDLGYFSVFRMVYPFESAAYNTPVGETSDPFRTRFGYHVVFVNEKRASRGEVKVAHIMVSNTQKDSTIVPKVRIQEIYKKILDGDKFDNLAKQFSDDKSTASRGGELKPFKTGQLSVPEFENQSFNLINPGDISEPFSTRIGWHIVKLIEKKPLGSIEDLKKEIEEKIKKDSRSQVINKTITSDLKQKYEVTDNEKALSYFDSVLDSTYFSNTWETKPDFNAQMPFLSIKEVSYDAKDFADYLKTRARYYTNKSMDFKVLISREYEYFIKDKLFKYREDHLEMENIEYANILKEYREGLLLFDLMEKEIWNKAVQDSIGFKTFFEDHKSSYMWEDRVEAVIVTGNNKKDLKKVANYLKSGISDDFIKKQINTDDKQNIIVSKGEFNLSDSSLPSNLILSEGVSEIYKHNGTYHVLDIKKVLNATEKTFDEAKGLATGDYQSFLEEKWIEQLKEKYDVQVNKEILDQVKAEFNQ